MIERFREIETIRRLLRRFAVVGITGARQVGKTTLARRVAADWKAPVAFFDLENPADLARLADPLLALREVRGLVVIDEIQRRPELFALLRVLVDRPRRPARFLVLGSASPELLRQGSESLAGRIAYHELAGFSLEETGIEHHPRLWLRGGFPARTSPPRMPPASSGVRVSCGPSSNGIFPNWGSTSTPRPCGASGPCWATTTARCGTRPSSAVLSASPTRPCAVTSIA